MAARARPSSDSTRKAVGGSSEVQIPSWLRSLGSRAINGLIALGFLWGSLKILFADGTFTLIAFHRINWLPDDWNVGGVMVWSIGRVTVWYAIAILMSLVQWGWFPWYIRSKFKTLEVGKSDDGPWFTRLSWRQDLMPWQRNAWFGVSFVNVGTSFSGLALYIRGDMSVEGINILPFWAGIKLPTEGAMFFAVVFAGALFTSQAPEVIGRRAFWLLFDALGLNWLLSSLLRFFGLR